MKFEPQTWIRKIKDKKIYIIPPKIFCEGEWCKQIIPDGDMVELTYTSRNGLLVIHDTPEIKVKRLEESKYGNREGEKKWNKKQNHGTSQQKS